MTRVALIGANGHGHWHRRHLVPRIEAGAVDLVGLCDLAPITDIDGASVPPSAGVFTDYRDLLAQTKPEVVIICTPPHTHLSFTTDALWAGCDVLLEKPPVLNLAEHSALLGVLADTGRAVQVGFQALGSQALLQLLAAISAGRLGEVTGIAAIASWQRSDAYHERAPWAGRRQLDGRTVIDGALVNPLAHAVMQCLAVAATASGTPHLSTVELERYRTRAIEVEDTGCLRVRASTGLPVLVAVTLCGEDFIAGEVVVHGTTGDAVLEYPTDRLRLPGDPTAVEVPGRVSLLDNLIAHRVSGEPLIAPLERTRSFTTVVEVIGSAPAPVLLTGDLVTVSGEAPQRHHTIQGINAVLREAARSMRSFHEAGVSWAVPPYDRSID